MKRLSSLLMLILPGVAVFADDAKPELKPYGFLKGDMYIATDGVSSWGQPQPTAVSRATGDTVNDQTMAFSAAHSRFGLKGNTDVGKINVGGVLELDFFSANSNTNFNANPRMRLAYAFCKPVQGLDIRIGQQWDLFSPLNPTTNNTNANLWYNGNYGFRRPQFQARYALNLEPVVPGIQLSIGEGAKEGSDIGRDNLSLTPMIQGRLYADIMEKITVGAGGAYTTHGKNDEIETYGISADLSLTLHKLFALKGEYGWGQNLNDVNIFNIAGNKFVTNDDDSIVNTTDKVISGFWFNATSQPLDFLTIVAGFAMESNLSDTIWEGTARENLTFYGDLIFPIGKYFSLTAEYQYVMTTVGFLDGDKEYAANVIDIAGKISF
ncbi:MAG: hypothetical protein GF350_17365 [Chitinivibrionales bacterium]|nr:hypothetical protein [Chitinivibrionales bacterium]